MFLLMAGFGCWLGGIFSLNKVFFVFGARGVRGFNFGAGTSKLCK